MIHKALVPVQWFRMLDKNGRDIGYMRVNQKTDTTLQHKGIQVDVQSRLMVNHVAYDTLANYFASDEQDVKTRNEVWSVRTTARPQAGAPKGAAEASWAETGFLSKGVLSLTRQSPQEKKPFEWDNLPDGYLPQAHAQILASLMSPADHETMAFYVYYANTGKLALRTLRVIAQKDGSYQVLTRASPEQEEEAAFYDASGKLIRRVLPAGQVLMPASMEQIVARWKVQQP
jgi:YD repeat-containing protein